MAKVTLEANELTDATVSMISMVKRGANKIPFKITKEDGTMSIDLHSIGRQLFNKTENSVDPTVVGVILAKGFDIEPLTKALVEAGIPADKFTKSETEDATVLMKSGQPPNSDETFIIKQSDALAFVVQAPAAIAKAMNTYDWESTSFSEVMSKGSFAPSLYIASDMFNRTCSNIMEKAESPADLAKQLRSAAEEYTAYLVELAKSLPKSVFKSESITKSVIKLGTTTETKKEEPAPAPAETKKEEPAPAPVEKKTDAAAAEDKKDGGKDDAMEDANGKKKPAKKEEADPKTDTGAADIVKALTDGIAGLKAHVDTVIKTVKADLDDVKSQVKKAEGSMASIVLGGERQDRQTPTRKSEEAPYVPPLLDSAFMSIDDSGQRRRG